MKRIELLRSTFSLLTCVLLIQTFVSSQVVINEVHVRPTGGDTDQAFQSMYNSTPSFGSEFIEIYNTSSCESVDISCWTIGGMDGGTNGGAFSFPSGTVIPPLGFITLGGPNTTGLTFNLNLPANALRLWRSNANRWHLPNGDGWVALYDDAGTPVDAVYWTFSSNDPGKLTTDATFTTGALQRIAACGGGPLVTASTIPGIEYISQATVTGQSFERTTDGGATWALGSATPNACNGSCAIANSFELNASVVQPVCGQSNGSISFNPSPTGNYSYSWLPAVSFTSSATSLAQGSYEVTITSDAGCSKDTTIVLTSLGGVTAVAINSLDPTCGQANGSISILSVTGGTPPYQYNFHNSGFSLNTNFNNLNAGAYSLVVQDAAGCQYTAPNILLTSSNGPTEIVVNATPANCGSSDGSIWLGAVTGGTPPYQYNFNSTGYGTTSVFNNLSAGTYSLSVQDATGCSFNAPAIIVSSGNGPTDVQVSIFNESCDMGNGSLIIGNVTGGTAPYEFNFNATGFSSTTTYNNLSAGSYSLVVQDNGGCTYTAPVVIIADDPGPTAVNVIVSNTFCGLNNGQVNIGTVIGGSPSYQFNFDGQGFGTTTSFTSLAAGTYSLVVQDANGCAYTAPEIVITASASPTSVDIAITDGTCGSPNGSLSLSNVVGGTAPYQFSINGQAFSGQTTFTGLSAGNYTVQVEDANGCIYVAPMVVLTTTSGPTDLLVDPRDATCGSNDGEISISGVTGGTAPYQYSINGSAFSVVSTFTGLSPGQYSLTVADVAGCVWEETVQIGGGSSPEAEFAIKPLAVSVWDPEVELINQSSSDAVEFQWFVPDGSPSTGDTEDLFTSFYNLPIGTYPITLMVTNTAGCTDTITKYVELYDEILIFAPNAFTPDGDEYNNVWKVFVSNADFTSFDLTIFNRWGELIFQSFDPEIGWDGILDGNLVQSGVYTWILSIKNVRNDERKNYVGHISLVR